MSTIQPEVLLSPDRFLHRGTLERLLLEKKGVVREIENFGGNWMVWQNEVLHG